MAILGFELLVAILGSNGLVAVLGDCLLRWNVEVLDFFEVVGVGLV